MLAALYRQEEELVATAEALPRSRALKWASNNIALDALLPSTMASDPRFARLKTDPRFRRPKKQQSTVAIDDRFKSVFDNSKKKTTALKGGVCYIMSLVCVHPLTLRY
jgi:hypothetical protein